MKTFRCLVAIGVCSICGTAATAAETSATQRGQLVEPVFRVPKHDPEVQPVQAVEDPAVPAGGVPAAQPEEHPLMPALRLAKNGLTTIDANIQDYTCTLVKRENVDGKIGDYEYIFLQVRHRPFSVYMYFLGPDPIKGRECIYVNGRNNGKLIAHEGGNKIFLPTVKIDPTGFIAMRGQRYPITEVGVRNLTHRLIEVAEQDVNFGECDVKFFKGAKINGRVCTCIQVKHPVPRKNFRFHIARIFIDDEHQFPIRFESYDWPVTQGGPPVLLEEYTYMNMKVNVGLADADFDERNPKFRFK